MANVIQVHWEPAWALTITHGTEGTFRVGSRDLSEAAAVTALGGFYQGRIRNGAQITVREKVTLGFDVPSIVESIEIDNTDAAFSRTAEWRGVPVVLRHYDAASNTARTEFVGVIIDRTFGDGIFIVRLGSKALDVLDTMIPTYVIGTGDFPYATDLGAAVPVVYGNASVRPPYVRNDTSSSAVSAGGYDYLVGWGKVVDGINRGPKVLKVYADVDSARAGLELLTQWEAAPGDNVTYVDDDEFSVEGAGLTTRYATGTLLRYKTTASAGAWLYSDIIEAPIEVAGTPTVLTVKIRDADLDAGLSDVYIAPDYVAEYNRYTIDTVPLTSLRCWSPMPSLLVEAQDSRGPAGSALTNPADVLEDILTTSDWGFNQSVDATSFADAVTAYSAAGLGSAIQYALAWDGRQLKFADLLTEIAKLRGGITSYDGATSSWKHTVDAAPSAATVTLGYRDGTWNNIYAIEEIPPPPLDQAVKNVRLFYYLDARATEAGSKNSNRGYRYNITSGNVASVGKTVTMTCPLIRDHTVAKRVVAYAAKNYQLADRGYTVKCASEARTVALRDLVRLKAYLTKQADGATLDVDADYRVHGIVRKLHGVELELRGYASTIFSYTGSDIDTPPEASIDEQVPSAGGGANLLINPDFSTGIRKAALTGDLDYESLPGWLVYDAPGRITALAVTQDQCAVGGWYLTVTVTGTDAQITANEPELFALRTTDGGYFNGSNYGGIYTMPLQRYACSVYCDRSDGWSLIFTWMTSNTVMRVDTPRLERTAEQNGCGWYRYYSPAMAPRNAGTPPTDADSLFVGIRFHTAGTFKFDGAQLERLSRSAVRPTEWKHYGRSALDPGMVSPGTLIRLGFSDDPEAGTRGYFRRSSEATLSGASHNLVHEGDGAALLVAGTRCESAVVVVTGAITYAGGADGFNLGTPQNATAFGKDVTLAVVGEATDDSYLRVVPVPITTATHLVISANKGGSFAGGKVKALATLQTTVAPTS